MILIMIIKLEKTKYTIVFLNRDDQYYNQMFIYRQFNKSEKDRTEKRKCKNNINCNQIN